MSVQYRSKKSIEWTFEFIESPAFLEFIELIPEAVIMSDTEGNILLTNQIAQSLFQYTKKEFNERVIEDLVPESIRALHTKMRKWFFKHPTPRFLASRELQLFAVKKDGQKFPMESALFAIQTEKGLIAVNLLRDISYQQQQEKQIVQFAFVDALTNLPNRRYFDSHMAGTAARVRRHHETIALMYLDLDGFKAANDTYGHQTGDKILKEIGLRMSAIVREEDFLARIGGDEFVLTVFPACDEDYLKKMAKRILAACKKPIKVGKQTFHLSASIGICTNDPNKAFDAYTFVHLADQTMYKAKARGGNCFECAFKQ